MNGTADNAHYTTSVSMESKSEIGIAVNSGVLCTLNARNASSQHGVHDKQTVRFYCHITLHRPVYMFAKNALQLIQGIPVLCNTEHSKTVLIIYCPLICLFTPSSVSSNTHLEHFNNTQVSIESNDEVTVHSW